MMTNDDYQHFVCIVAGSDPKELMEPYNKNKIEIDRYEIGIVINSLNTMRNKIKEEQKAPTEINEILLKIIDETDKKKVFSRTLTRGNGRRY